MFEMSRGGIGVGGGGGRDPVAAIFTVSQWKELQHQALIFKYLLSGHQVPPELLLPIHNSSFYFDSTSSSSPSNFFLTSATATAPMEGYYASSYYGKKMDPEPGRCRRTDGKKWRCAKDAFPESKYCERHMRKRKNNNAGSRKPVEIHTSLSSMPTTPSLSRISALTSLSTGGGSGMTTANNGGSFFPLLSMGNNNDQRYSYATKSQTTENGFFLNTSQSAKSFGMQSSLDNTYGSILPQASLVSPSKLRNGSLSLSDYPQALTLQNLRYATSTTNQPKQPARQQYWSFDSESASRDTMKHDNQSLQVQSSYEDWPNKTRDYWLDQNDNSDHSPFSTTTQLSMSMPVASFGSSAASSHSPN
ncbi:hypothetical protein C5167_041107 [Papaver somniferum]|uniref:Growth-regulating factor n=1 Tax=Papaver somniferum TaxID=3469 RepID=A0A4Y7IKA7_PAPSO|nr:growth-regulating factor 5-like [Papaver somniferum]RZC48161.1 hypothetical protein C5167_041107 [Papaver somniferum]